VTTKSKKGAKALGSVVFVGTGPGDPSLITVRAVEVLTDADAVVVDHGVDRAVLAHAPVDAEIIDDTGGEAGQPMAQAARIKLIVAAAKAGRQVVHLLHGDPSTYDDLVEEAAACAKAGIRFEIVPGVPVMTAVPMYAGVPLISAKDHSFRVIDLEQATPDWSRYGDETLVLLGSLDHLAEATKGLLAVGRDPDTPVAITIDGTTTAQRTVVSSLSAATRHARSARLEGPLVTVVGEVVQERETLSWYESKPLFGWRVLVPRTKEQAGALSAALRSYGAIPEEVPTISVEPPRNPQQMEKAIRGLVEGRYEWIIFTSANAVRAVRERFEEYGLDARAFSGLKIAAVGDQTAKALGGLGINADLVPSGEQSARGLVEDWPPYDELLDPINRVFLPRADIATETLVAGLAELGWEVDDVTAYRTVRAAPPAVEVREAIKTGKFDAVVFTSSSTVRNLVGIAGKPHACTVVACIGPQTAKTAEEHGLRVDVMAENPSVAELAAALADFAATRRLASQEAGEPVTKPSDKKRSTARRRAT
jgi:uroporphyrinogen III methyltransferase / synthase